MKFIHFLVVNMRACLIILALAISVSSFPANDVEKNPFIVGGENAANHSAPYIITLQSQATGGHSCGGSILNVNWILTAAHCIPAHPLQIVAGQHDLTHVSGTEQLRLVAQSILHAQYDPETLFNDIAVLRLATPLVLVPGIVEVTRLPQPGVIPSSGTVTMHGWGSISRTEVPIIPAILQTVQKPIIAGPQCQAIVDVVWPGRPLYNEVCTGPLDGSITACFGDSGGPLVQPDEGGVIEQIGIAAWIGGSPCGQLNAPTVYVRVSAYLSWIAENIAS